MASSKTSQPSKRTQTQSAPAQSPRYEQLQLPHFSDIRSSSSPAAAPRAAAGFYYQLPYACLAALELNVGETLGVEVVDDIDTSGPEGARRIQLKQEATPVTDMNRGLWKALANWSILIESGPRHDIKKLLFATTAPIQGRFPELLATATTAEARCKYVLENIRASTDDALKLHIKRVTSLSPGMLASLLGRVSLVQEGGATELLRKIRVKLRRQFHDEDLEQAAHELMGWVTQSVAEATESNKGAVIFEDRVREVVLNIQNRRRPQKLSYRHRNTALGPIERATHRNSTFLRQLEAINASDSLINMALEDYLRQLKEEVEWAKHLEVGERDLDEYSTQIYEMWRVFSEDIAGHLRDLNDADYGLGVYDDMLRSRSPRLFCDGAPPAHVFRGSCHKLANKPHIGWHRRWETLFGAHNPEDKE